MSYTPASNTTSNLPQSTVIYYDKSFIDNLKANTPFLKVASRRDLPENSGNQLRLYMYNTLAANTTQSTEGTVGTGISVSVSTTTATIGEYADFTTFSSLSLATAIDPVVENVQREFAYRLGQSLSALTRTVIDSASGVDSSVSVQLAASSTSSFTVLSNTVLRSAVMSLQGRNVMAIEGTHFGGVIHPFALGDVLADTSNNGVIDILKHTQNGLMKLDDLGGITQEEVVEFPSTSVQFYKSTQVTQTTNYKGVTGLTALRTYILGKDGVIAINLGAKGDTAFGEGDWRNIKCNVMGNAPVSLADPSGLIPGWTSYKCHFTNTLPPDTTMRVRTIDAASGIS